MGRKVRHLREALDLTQEELADRAGLHRNYIGRIERGESNVGVKALLKLARGLGVEPAALFERLRLLPRLLIWTGNKRFRCKVHALYVAGT